MLGRTAAAATGAVAGLLADPPEQAASALIIVYIAKALPRLCMPSLIPASPSFRCVMRCIVSLCEAK
jgi:hypothetical protein